MQKDIDTPHWSQTRTQSKVSDIWNHNHLCVLQCAFSFFLLLGFFLRRSILNYRCIFVVDIPFAIYFYFLLFFKFAYIILMRFTLIRSFIRPHRSNIAASFFFLTPNEQQRSGFEWLNKRQASHIGQKQFHTFLPTICCIPEIQRPNWIGFVVMCAQLVAAPRRELIVYRNLCYRPLSPLSFFLSNRNRNNNIIRTK